MLNVLSRDERIIENSRLADKKRRGFELAFAIAVQLNPIDPIARAQNRLTGHAIRQARTWGKVVIADIAQVFLADAHILRKNSELLVIRIGQRDRGLEIGGRYRGLIRYHDGASAASRGRVKACKTEILFRCRPVDLVPHSQVNGQVGSWL